MTTTGPSSSIDDNISSTPTTRITPETIVISDDDDDDLADEEVVVIHHLQGQNNNNRTRQEDEEVSIISYTPSTTPAPPRTSLGLAMRLLELFNQSWDPPPPTFRQNYSRPPSPFSPWLEFPASSSSSSFPTSIPEALPKTSRRRRRRVKRSRAGYSSNVGELDRVACLGGCGEPLQGKSLWFCIPCGHVLCQPCRDKLLTRKRCVDCGKSVGSINQLFLNV